MQSPHDRDRETADLIKRFQSAAARRHKRRLILTCVAAVAVVGAVTAALVFALSSPDSTDAVNTSSSEDGILVSAPATTSTTSTTLTSHTIAITTITQSTVQSTVQSSTTSTAASSGYLVVLDPGHQAKADPGQEPIGPGSEVTKDRVSSGTRSINTGSPESELVLKVALKLRDALQADGIQVVMTRTTQDVWISNAERAQIANAAGADLFVRIHADGATDTSIHGILMLYPATISGWTDDIASESKRAAQLALDYLVAATGAKNRGMVARKDITGFNWSDVPVILPEIGLMTNKTEDALLATDEYQDKIVQGLADAIMEYLGVR